MKNKKPFSNKLGEKLKLSHTAGRSKEGQVPDMVNLGSVSW